METAVEIMLKNKIRKLPIVDANETIMGIVTITVSCYVRYAHKRKVGLTSSNTAKSTPRGKGPRLVIRVISEQAFISAKSAPQLFEI